MLGQVIQRALFDRVLIDPLNTSCAPDSLHIVSGYATYAMASHHMLEIQNEHKNLAIDLVVGMAGIEGVRKADHLGFLSLQTKKEFDFKGSFDCSYVKRPMSIHSKVYVWCKGAMPVKAFIGSANYSENGFNQKSRIETVAECDPESAFKFFCEAKKLSVDCQGVNREVDFPEKLRGIEIPKAHDPVVMIETDPASPYKGCLKIIVSLLIEKGSKKGTVGEGSRLNWGVMSDGTPRRNKKDDATSASRDPNQAYIALPTPIQKSGFFPEYNRFAKGRNEQSRFTILTDDGRTFSCVRTSGDYGKEIETPQDNSELGRYFRERLGLPSGAFITPQDLKRYGRYDVAFYKLDDETYVMDFSQPNK